MNWTQIGQARHIAASEALEEQLQGALSHLYDGDYQAESLLSEAVTGEPLSSPSVIQSAVLHEIESLQPPSDVPPNALGRRIYDILHCRYVLRLTLEETAARLSISVRHLTRLQRDAVHTLSRVLWERWLEHQQQEGDVSQNAPATDLNLPEADMPDADWRAQMKRELASLEEREPGAVADVATVLENVIELERIMEPGNSALIKVGAIQPGLTAAVHPSVLQQMLITAIMQICEQVMPSSMLVFARLEDGEVIITLKTDLGAPASRLPHGLAQYTLVPEGASVAARIDQGCVYLRMSLPSVGVATVLVVDDNLDMARFYRRCAEGTRYRIAHVASGHDLSDAIGRESPAAIVLDVMLPDIDGWRLLMHLHQNAGTREIPVIVCSVVREEKLALSLGAALYLPKPVRRRQFISALDHVLAG